MKDYVCINSYTHFSKWRTDISITFRGILFYFLMRIIAPRQKEIEMSHLTTLDKEGGKHVIASIE